MIDIYFIWEKQSNKRLLKYIVIIYQFKKIYDIFDWESNDYMNANAVMHL